MKVFCLLYLMFVCQPLVAQTNDTTVTIVDNKAIETDTVIPTTNKYGDLLNDDPVYNPKYARWKPATRVVVANAVNWALAKYFYKFDWPATIIADWKNNFKKGPEWDVDGLAPTLSGTRIQVIIILI